VTRLQVGQSGAPNPVGARYFCLIKKLPEGSEAHPDLFIGCQISFPDITRLRCEFNPSPPSSVKTIRMSGVVHSCQQKSIGLKFSKSQTGCDVRYICHHNSSRFTFTYLRIRAVSLSSIHYNQSHRVYINRRQQYICFI